jgi:hypothetical protein
MLFVKTYRSNGFANSNPIPNTNTNPNYNPNLNPNLTLLQVCV